MTLTKPNLTVTHEEMLVHRTAIQPGDRAVDVRVIVDAVDEDGNRWEVNRVIRIGLQRVKPGGDQ